MNLLQAVFERPHSGGDEPLGSGAVFDNYGRSVAASSCRLVRVAAFARSLRKLG